MTTPARVRITVTPVAAALWAATVTCAAVLLFWDHPRVLAALAGAWAVGLVTFATLRPR